MRRSRFVYGGLLAVLAVYIVIALILSAERAGVQVDSSDESASLLLPVSAQLSAGQVAPELAHTCLVITDSRQEESVLALEQFAQILLDMKVGYDLADLSTAVLPSPSSYDTCIVLMNDLSPFGERIFELMDYVYEGGRVMFALTLGEEPTVNLIQRQLGIISTGYDNAPVDRFHPTEDFMLGGGVTYGIVDAYDAARNVQLDGESVICAWNDDERHTPLVWTRTYGKGRFVVDNIGFCEKATRGFYAASYSLLEDACVWPVLDGCVFYLDDFPSPVPGGDGEYITRDYQMSVSDFYANVWWPDLLALANRYRFRYTGVLIENYEDDTSGKVKRQEDTSRFQYFGNMLLHTGGEIGFHGYNHQPLSLSNVDYEDILPYNTWESKEAMYRAVEELVDFAAENFPTAARSVYVPPSNVISREGLDLLAQDFPQIRTVASTYFPGECAYPQEFGIHENGIIEQPRIVSGAGMGDYEKMVALSELNMHYVFTHFMHPDDLLDVDRGAALGWEALKGKLDDILAWLFTSVPDIRRMTGSELSAVIQRYSAVTIEKERKGNTLVLHLGHFTDTCPLMLRLNWESPGQVRGAQLSQLTGSLYLVMAEQDTVEIELEEKQP